jgi:hypothetical protein
MSLGFLGAWPFRKGFHDLSGLDFLGFSRPKLDFSMSYADSHAENFSSRFLPEREPRQNERLRSLHRKA